MPNGKRGGEADHKDGCGCQGDQIDGPGVLPFADKVEVTRVAFVSIDVNVHGRASPLRRITDRPPGVVYAGRWRSVG